MVLLMSNERVKPLGSSAIAQDSTERLINAMPNSALELTGTAKTNGWMGLLTPLTMLHLIADRN